MKNEKQMNNPSNNRKYKWKMIFKNGMKIDGNGDFPSLDEVYKVFLMGNFNHLQNDKKGLYYNSDEILYLEVEELLEEDK